MTICHTQHIQTLLEVFQFVNSVQLDSSSVGVKAVLAGRGGSVCGGWGLCVLHPPICVGTTLAHANGKQGHHCG